MTKEEWKQQILKVWDIYGNGKPLDPAVVDYLSEEFSKPIEFPPPQFKRSQFLMDPYYSIYYRHRYFGS